tara:strand:- start:456 stop:1292 length:837 start_codon:yes stop_codon:yes gene_type:complete
MNNLTIANEYNTVFEKNLWTKNELGNYINGDEQFVTTHKGITNEQGHCIAVVGRNYNLVQNADIMPQFHEVILASDLDKTDMTKDIQQSHMGAKTIVTYTFPAHRIEIATGDFVDLKIMVLNSYDGSWKFMSMVGAVRLACMNGQVIADAFSEYSAKHTRSLDIDVAVAKLETALIVYTKNTELWKKYPQSPVTNAQATAIFQKVAGKSDRLELLLEETYLKYVNEMGKNLWAVFNTLTDWSSHAKFKNEANKVATIYNREAKVRKAIPMLNELLLVA